MLLDLPDKNIILLIRLINIVYILSNVKTLKYDYEILFASQWSMPFQCWLQNLKIDTSIQSATDI